MSITAVTVSPPGALEELAGKLATYQEVSGKTASAILLQKGAQLVFGNTNPKFGAVFRGLYQQFSAQASLEGTITASAKLRSFRLGRREFGGNLSPTAVDRALQKMGGFRSIWATVSESNGRIRLSGVRVGLSGRRLRTPRTGARRGFAVPGVVDTLRREGDVRLNLRAVATVEEINLRESGRGFMGVAWLFKRWRKFAKEGWVPAGTAGFREGFNKSFQFGGVEKRLINTNPRSRLGLLGEAQLTGALDEGQGLLRLSSYVPGTITVGVGRGLFARTLSAMSADLDVYLARKSREALLAHFTPAGQPPAAA